MSIKFGFFLITFFGFNLDFYLNGLTRKTDFWLTNQKNYCYFFKVGVYCKRLLIFF